MFIKVSLHFIGLRILKKLGLWPDECSAKVFITASVVTTRSGAVAWASAATSVSFIYSLLICVLGPVAIVGRARS